MHLGWNMYVAAVSFFVSHYSMSKYVYCRKIIGMSYIYSHSDTAERVHRTLLFICLIALTNKNNWSPRKLIFPFYQLIRHKIKDCQWHIKVIFLIKAIYPWYTIWKASTLNILMIRRQYCCSIWASFPLNKLAYYTLV